MFRQEAAGLHLPHSGIVSVFIEELEVGTLLDDVPLVEDEDPVHFGKR